MSGHETDRDRLAQGVYEAFAHIERLSAENERLSLLLAVKDATITDLQARLDAETDGNRELWRNLHYQEDLAGRCLSERNEAREAFEELASDIYDDEVVRQGVTDPDPFPGVAWSADGTPKLRD